MSHGKRTGDDLTASEPPRQRPALSPASIRLEDLSTEELRLTAGFLTGFDLLRLTHADPLLYRHALLRSDGHAWQRIVPAGSHRASLSSSTAKRRYFTLRSLRFVGSLLTEDRSKTSGRGGAIEMPSVMDWKHYKSFAIDVWFALLPPTVPSIPAGGVLVGTQATGVVHGFLPVYHQQILCLDAQCNLYCSFMRHKPVVAKAFNFGRLYHVVLAFQDGAPGRQRVFLDGELVDTADGDLPDWCRLSFTQLGTGCITNGGFDPLFGGWHAFHELVDECRVWRGTLGDADVRVLAAGGAPPAIASAECTWSLSSIRPRPACGTVDRVRCTRPIERVVASVALTERLSTPRRHMRQRKTP